MEKLTAKEAASLRRFAGDPYKMGIPLNIDDQNYWGFDRTVYYHDWERFWVVYRNPMKANWLTLDELAIHRKNGTLTDCFEDMYSRIAENNGTKIKKWVAAYKRRGDGVEDRRQYLAEESFGAVRVAERAYFEFRDFRDVFVDMDAEAKAAIEKGVSVFELPPVKRYHVKYNNVQKMAGVTHNLLIDTYNIGIDRVIQAAPDVPQGYVGGTPPPPDDGTSGQNRPGKYSGVRITVGGFREMFDELGDNLMAFDDLGEFGYPDVNPYGDDISDEYDEDQDSDDAVSESDHLESIRELTISQGRPIRDEYF